MKVTRVPADCVNAEKKFCQRIMNSKRKGVFKEVQEKAALLRDSYRIQCASHQKRGLVVVLRFTSVRAWRNFGRPRHTVGIQLRAADYEL